VVLLKETPAAQNVVSMKAIQRVGMIAAAVLAAWQAAARAQEFDTWFTVTRVADGVRRIEERGAVNLYLVEGRDRALLIDTGTGLTKLGEFARTLTTRPLTVVVTHAHPDHAGAKDQFASVAVDPAETEGMAFFSEPKSREFLKYMVGIPGTRRPGDGARPRRQRACVRARRSDGRSDRLAGAHTG
jgi:glyoxylase-like metal-dependent hydrolase (beta-lactamase superfamily II)